MTLRERIADWISGGALSRQKTRDYTWAAACASSALQVTKLKIHLECIAACETPGANATVRRMAKIAREALE
ncbi:hypothetical protein [Neotabrizicola sp. sgz301269]|uniref:hypothetical protein n=1 Tax=Neotabrizicola sp. sgz301269 TaxID=3276282 RepID=UPI00376FC023